jgi:hypothetical protein
MNVGANNFSDVSLSHLGETVSDLERSLNI